MIFSFLASLVLPSALAQEPGFLLNNALPSTLKSPASQSSPAPAASHQALLSEQFANSRGLRAYEIQTIHYNRIACARRIFNASGMSIEGDGDLKAVSVPPDFIEVEFPSHIGFDSFGAQNPFANGVTDMDTVTSRQLVKVRDWSDGQPLILRKHVTLRFSEEGKAPQTVSATAEMRVKDGTYPSTYIIRETIEGPSVFKLYYICQ